MNAKQYLKQAYRLDELIKSDKEELSKLRELSTSISSQVISDEPRTSTGSSEAKFAKIIEQIDELDYKIKNELSKYIALQNDIRTTINNVTDFNQRLLLRYRYLDFMSWEEIAKNLSYAMTQTHRLHSNALKNIKMV